MQVNNQNQIKKPTLSFRRFRKLENNPFAIFDKLMNTVYHAGSIEDAQALITLLNQLHQNLKRENSPSYNVEGYYLATYKETEK